MSEDTEADYQFEAEILDVHDGDTCTARVSLGFDVYVVKKLRLYGIDTPELTSHSTLIKNMALAAKKELKKFVGKDVIIVSHKKGKYGRYLVDIYYNDRHINQELIDKGLAKPYYGEKRPTWP